MKKGAGSESTIIIGPSKPVLVYALRIRPRRCPISGVRAKIILLYVIITATEDLKNSTLGAFFGIYNKNLIMQFITSFFLQPTWVAILCDWRELSESCL